LTTNSISPHPHLGSRVADYIALLKPRVMSLVIFTAWSARDRAGHVHPVLAFTSILCHRVGAGASGALNMWYEGDIDAKMSRTANRPIPRGRVTEPNAGVRHDPGVLLGDDVGILVNWFAARCSPSPFFLTSWSIHVA